MIRITEETDIGLLLIVFGDLPQQNDESAVFHVEGTGGQNQQAVAPNGFHAGVVLGCLLALAHVIVERLLVGEARILEIAERRGVAHIRDLGVECRHHFVLPPLRQRVEIHDGVAVFVFLIRVEHPVGALGAVLHVMAVDDAEVALRVPAFAEEGFAAEGIIL